MSGIEGVVSVTLRFAEPFADQALAGGIDRSNLLVMRNHLN